MFDLTGRTAVVTGGSKNIGRALAMGLAAAGADVIISARRPGPLRDARDEIRERTGRRVECVAGDVRDRADVDQIVTLALEKFGGADILINNAYDNGEPEADEHRALGLLESSDEVWQRCIAANLLAPARLCAGLCPAMRRRGNGSVINILSTAAFSVVNDRAVYGITKAALWHFTRTLAAELAPAVRVNAISIGTITEDGKPRNPGQAAVAGSIPMKRLGSPQEVVGTALLLASDAGSYLTGQVIGIDGGRVRAAG